MQLGASLLTKAVFPTSAHLKQALAFMDLAVKIEFILLELTSNMFWGSVLELGAFTVAVLIFLRDSTELGTIWFFTPHVVRGIIGLLIMRGLPTTHDIVKTASIPHDERLKIDKVFEYITRAAREALDHFTASTKRNLMLYFGLTLLCGPIDLLCFLASIKGYASEKSPYADTTLLVASLTLLIVDVFYLSWMNSLSHRVPPYVSAAVAKAAFGVMGYMHAALGETLEKQRMKRDENLKR